jgi:hypothetical protein
MFQKNPGYTSDLRHNENLIVAKAHTAMLVLREPHPDYIMPVGVWQVREHVRNAMCQPPLKFNTLEEALQRIVRQFDVPLKRWIRKSELLRNALFQKRITDFWKEVLTSDNIISPL